MTTDCNFILGNSEICFLVCSLFGAADAHVVAVATVKFIAVVVDLSIVTPIPLLGQV